MSMSTAMVHYATNRLHVKAQKLILLECMVAIPHCDHASIPGGINFQVVDRRPLAAIGSGLNADQIAGAQSDS